MDEIIDVFIRQINEIRARSRWKEPETKQTKTLQITWPSQEGRSPSTSVLHRLKLNEEFYLFINFLLLLLLPSCPPRTLYGRHGNAGGFRSLQITGLSKNMFVSLATGSVTRLGDLLDLVPLFKAFGNN